MRASHLALSCSVFCLCGCSARGCTVPNVPRHETMALDGPVAACGNIFIARMDVELRRALLLDLELEHEPLAIDTARAIDVTSLNRSSRPVVEMEDWAHRNYYCDCSTSMDEPVRWRAIRGRMTITRMAHPTNPELSILKAHGSRLVLVNARGDIREVPEWDVPHFGINLKAQW